LYILFEAGDESPLMASLTDAVSIHLLVERPKKEQKMKTIRIKGMTCQHCVMAVTKALGGISGIENVKVNLERGEASFDETKPVDMSVVRERVKKAGYDVI